MPGRSRRGSTHVALDLAVDFDAKRVGGTATLDIDRKPGREGNHPRRQGPGDREHHRRLEASRSTARSARPIRSSARRLTVALRPDTQAARHQVQDRARCRRAAMADARADRRQEDSPICSARARRSRTAAGSRPRIRPASARPGKRRSTCPPALTAVMSAPKRRRADHPGRRERLQLQDGPQPSRPT